MFCVLCKDCEQNSTNNCIYLLKITGLRQWQKSDMLVHVMIQLSNESKQNLININNCFNHQMVQRSPVNVRTKTKGSEEIT